MEILPDEAPTAPVVRRPRHYELPMGATEKLRINLGSKDAYSKEIKDVIVSFYKVDSGIDTLLVSSDLADSSDLSKDGEGLYSFIVDGELTEDGGEYRADWSWKSRRGESFRPRRASLWYTAQDEAPDYYTLSDDYRTIALSVANRFSDLFDNSLGDGAFNFYEQYQSSYGLNRIAQMMGFAVGFINTKMVPNTRYTLTGQGVRFPMEWASVLELGTYIEVLRHAVRTYVEQPSIIGGVDVPYADRRDYMQRWSTVLDETQRSFTDQIASMRRAHLNLGGTSTLVSGGIFGNIGAMATNIVYRGQMKMAYAPAGTINI